ncbi:hypothetical protein M768_03735 [Cellulosimicrobium cellulans F16]|uniref:Uncharacterized protein n=1 Tax=Cellulosimicrobium cellulans F16 TaxID=1350482 RepID=A0A0M0FC82_CELCE|nr:hypothetical protein M768_03735 [Cellulosimicrobium cellulans F16]
MPQITTTARHWDGRRAPRDGQRVAGRGMMELPDRSEPR